MTEAVPLFARELQKACSPPAWDMSGRSPAGNGGWRQTERFGNLHGAAATVYDLIDCHHAADVTEIVKSRQAEITAIGIDALRHPLDRSGMVDHDSLMAAMLAKLESGEWRGAEIARRLSIAPARITEMKKGERLLQQREMPIIAEMLGLSSRPHHHALKSVISTTIPVLGKVAQGVWMEQSFADTDQPNFVTYDMQAGDPGPEDLFAVLPEGQSMNLRFPPGTILICRRVPLGNGAFRSGSYVIAERTAHDMRELTCKRVEIDKEGVYWLHSESDRPEFAEPWRVGRPSEDHHDDMQIIIVGRVVRAVQNFD